MFKPERAVSVCIYIGLFGIILFANFNSVFAQKTGGEEKVPRGMAAFDEKGDTKCTFERVSKNVLNALKEVCDANNNRKEAYIKENTVFCDFDKTSDASIASQKVVSAFVGMCAEKGGKQEVRENSGYSHNVVLAGETCAKVFKHWCVQGTSCPKADQLCVVNPKNRRIGTWCSRDEHCDTSAEMPVERKSSRDKKGKKEEEEKPKEATNKGLALLCGEKNYCVGATRGTKCLDVHSGSVNYNPAWGKRIQALDSKQRCARGLVCDPESRVCEHDIGQKKILARNLAGESSGIEFEQVKNIILGFLGAISAIIIMSGGITRLRALGDEETLAKAKKLLIIGSIGLAITGIVFFVI